MSTRAIGWLRKKKIDFSVVSYAHAAKGAVYAARATGFPLNQTIKTLVVDLGGKSFGLALMPGDRQLSLKKLARALGVKKAALADAPAAERLTGYHVGGISPFGLRQGLPIVMEQSLLVHDQVLINGGQRGVLLKMAPGDIAAGLNSRLGDLLADSAPGSV
ncbi:MAG: YbaK/EbsC family protein [Desulfobacterales bacterium]|jgi:Cys-tRNA(Pro)/Cys-tRNA(Cys) deacylase